MSSLPFTKEPLPSWNYDSHATFRRFRLVFCLISLLGVAYLFLHTETSPAPEDPNVPLELFVMSKCPDAAFCERVIDDVLSEVGDIVNLSVHYIATINSTSQYGARCPHGDGECLGDIQQLCVKYHYPAPNVWYNFLLCQNKLQFSIPSETLAESCAGQYGIDWSPMSPVKQCIDGPRGVELLQESANVKDERGVTKSCTIFLNGIHRCIHDGSWYSCPGGHHLKDFVRDICTMYGHHEEIPAACSNPPKKHRFGITMQSTD